MQADPFTEESLGSNASSARWSAEQAREWYSRQPWLVGCNFIPSTAINQIEMWQAETFDLPTIDRELGWAAAIGFNSVRVFLHDLVWQADADGFKQRIDQYLDVAAGHRIRTAFVFFDDCWNQDPALGRQPEPRPGVHNSGWVQSPGCRVVRGSEWGRLERYVRGILDTFAGDQRIVFWDLYNEPGNGGLGDESLALLQAAFGWARATKITQPLTAGLWFDNAALAEFQLAASDVVTFHHYGEPAELVDWMSRLKPQGRPLICTEYMARSRGSLFATHLPVFRRERVGCYSWGLVSGKTQTIYPWDSPAGAPEPAQWFHDIFHRDGTPFDPEEVRVIAQLTGNA